MRRSLFCFLFIIVFPLTFSLCEAATISPDLQAVLQTAPPGQEVAIIINLADKVDVKNIPGVPANHTREGRKIRRNAIAAALKDKADKTQGPIKALLQNRGAKKTKPLWITNSIAVTVPAATINELAGSPQIASIELDAVIKSSPITPAISGTPRWNIDRVNAPLLWAAGITGDNAVVASLDTGVDLNHPDLKYRWRGGACSSPPDCPSWYDPYNNTTIPYGIPATPPTTYEEILLNDTHVHGTHVMGIMVGGSASGNVIGVAPGAKWISAKIFDDTGNALGSDIIGALQWVLQPAGDSANAPDVVNNSWQIDTSQNACDTTFLSAISNLQAVDIEVVFSAGNVQGTAPPSSSFSPANNAGVFAVGATDCVGSGCSDPSNVIAPFSALGPSACSDRPYFPTFTEINFPNVVAPGSSIRSSVPVGSTYGGAPQSYLGFSGTSQSAPHSSAGAALLASAIPGLTPAQIEEAFQNSALPLGSGSPNNTYGYGLLDVAAAYQYAFTNFVNGGTPQPKIAGLDPSLFFINTSTSADLTFVIVNQGTADLTISGISFAGLNPADFAVSGTDTCSGVPIPSLGNCSVTITFSPGAAGSRSAQLSFTSNDPSIPTTFDVPLHGNDPVARAQDASHYSGLNLVSAQEIVATYADIQSASGDCTNWDTIQMQAVTLTESPVFDLPLGITVSLLGGYDAAFVTHTGFTTIQGTLTISKGTVIVGNVTVL